MDRNEIVTNPLQHGNNFFSEIRYDAEGETEMKRIVIICLAFALLVGCQPTPEQEIIVNKGNQGEMIEASRSDEQPADADLRTQYHIPEHMTGSYTSADGLINVTVDAEIVVPDGPLPIVRVYAAEFEQPIVTAFWNELVGDRVLYDQWENEETKADIENELKNYTDQLNQIQSGAIDENEAMFSVDELTEMIAELQARYPYAPDGHEKTVETGMLHKQYLPLGKDKKAASRFGISARSAEGESWMQFCVENNSDNAERLIYRNGDGYDAIDVWRCARLKYNRESAKTDCFEIVQRCQYAEMHPVKPGDPIPNAAAGSLSLTPAEAYAEIDRFLTVTGLSDTYMISRSVVSGDSERPDTPSTQYAYTFELVRKIGGVPCNRSLLSTYASRTNEEEYAPSWNYERFQIGLDENGIFSVYWYSPFSIGDTINEQAKLKDFSEIQTIAERMLPMMKVENFDSSLASSADRTIDRIELGLWRIAEQNELGKGMLVPAYCFYGTDHYSYTVHDSVEDSYKSRIILIINAVDGTIIDPMKGY